MKGCRILLAKANGHDVACGDIAMGKIRYCCTCSIKESRGDMDKIEKLLQSVTNQCLGEIKPRISVDYLIVEIEKILGVKK